MSAVNGFETLRSRPWVVKWAYIFSFYCCAPGSTTHLRKETNGVILS